MDAETIKQEAASIISNYYDGDNDTMPGLPRVTHTDMRLLEMVIKTNLIIETLQRRIRELEARR